MRYLIAMLLFVVPALAQDNPFWTRQTVALVAADTAAHGADAYFTHLALAGRTLHNGCFANGQCYQYWHIKGTELDPIAAPFVKSTAGQVAYFSTTLAGDVTTAYLLHKTGHRKLERAVLAYGIGYSVQGAGWSAHTAFTF
jgi:hypothetical protein